MKKSGKRRRVEIKAARIQRAGRAALPRPDVRFSDPSAVSAPCNPALLAPYNSYGQPDFVARGIYVDKTFRCRQCETQEVWTATQQKCWYEIAKGHVESTAVLCRSCRRRERERRHTARTVAQAGLERKRQLLGK